MSWVEGEHTAFSMKLVNLGHHMGRERVLLPLLGISKRVCVHGEHVIDPGDGGIGVVHEVLALCVWDAVVPEWPHLLHSCHGGYPGHLYVLLDNLVVDAKRCALEEGEVEIHSRNGMEAVGMQVGEEGGIVLDGLLVCKEGQAQKAN